MSSKMEIKFNNAVVTDVKSLSVDGRRVSIGPRGPYVEALVPPHPKTKTGVSAGELATPMKAILEKVGIVFQVEGSHLNYRGWIHARELNLDIEVTHPSYDGLIAQMVAAVMAEIAHRTLGMPERNYFPDGDTEECSVNLDQCAPKMQRFS